MVLSTASSASSSGYVYRVIADNSSLPPTAGSRISQRCAKINALGEVAFQTTDSAGEDNAYLRGNPDALTVIAELGAYSGSCPGPPAIQCTQGVCTDVHDVDNGYRHGGSVELFTDFLARLNGGFDPAAATGCFAGRCDWRIPEISELQTILIGPDADPAQLPSCSGSNCIDPDFEAVAGAVARAKVWAVNRDAADSGRAWAADFATGTVFTVGATNFVYARAVRSGSCAQ